MPREHFNDMPGDISGSDAEDLPGGIGGYDPDNDIDATIDELVDNDVRGPSGESFYYQDQQGGDTTGTGYVEASNEGSTVPMADLLEGEEGHPGAAVGFTGAELDKKAPPPQPPHAPEEMPIGGMEHERETVQQQENMSVETEGPTGSQGSGGADSSKAA
jgi:hypothetical protein